MPNLSLLILPIQRSYQTLLFAVRKKYGQIARILTVFGEKKIKKRKRNHPARD
jgi:hypothetical protein